MEWGGLGGGEKVLKKREGSKVIARFGAEEPVVGITTFKGKLIVATTKGVYQYPKDRKKEVKK